MARFRPSQKISPDEHHEWASRMWKRMDRDENGRITRGELDCEEFRSVIRSVVAPDGGIGMGGAHYARAEMNMNQAINFCLRKADLNNDNGLSFTEFKSFLLCLRQDVMAQDTASLIFALFDLDGDHLLVESEFREICRFYLGHAPTEAEFQKAWAELDKDGKQRVTKAEYIRWLQASPNPIFRQHAPLPDPDATMYPDGGPPKGRLPLLRQGGNQRPLWNQRLDVANLGVRCPLARRTYFSRPQSLPELGRYYEKHRGFAIHRQRMQQPEVPPYRNVLSNEKGREFHPARAKPGGSMRNRSTGKLEAWEDQWQVPKCVKPKFRPGSLLLRTMPAPPKWMVDYKGDYELLSPAIPSSSTGMRRRRLTRQRSAAAWVAEDHNLKRAKALLVVGGAVDGTAEVLGSAGASIWASTGVLLYRALEEVGEDIYVIATPSIGDADVPAMRLISIIEQCLSDTQLVGGVAGLIVTSKIPAEGADLNVQVVRALVEHGIVGSDAWGSGKWRSVILCGTYLDEAEEEDVESFKTGVADSFFDEADGDRMVVAVRKEDSSPLLEAICSLPETRICYETPDAEVLAETLAEALGMECEEFAQQLSEMRSRTAGEAQQLETLKQDAMAPRALQQRPVHPEEQVRVLHSVMSDRSGSHELDCAIS